MGSKRGLPAWTVALCSDGGVLWTGTGTCSPHPQCVSWGVDTHHYCRDDRKDGDLGIGRGGDGVRCSGRGCQHSTWGEPYRDLTGLDSDPGSHDTEGEIGSRPSSTRSTRTTPPSTALFGREGRDVESVFDSGDSRRTGV